MFCWCFFEGTLMKQRWFDASNNDHLCFFASLWIFDVSLLLHWIFVDESLKNFSEALMFLIRTVMIRCLFKVLVSETFMFLYCVSDGSLMILRRSLVDTAEIWMQTVMMICLFEVLIFETRTFLLLLHCCFFDDSLMRFRWTMESSMETLLISKNYAVLIFQTVMFLWCFNEFLLMSLMSLRRSIVEKVKISKQTVMMICLFEVQIFETLMFFLLLHWWFNDDSLIRHWWTLEISMQTFLTSQVFIVLFF